jgi:hypothetical protein
VKTILVLNLAATLAWGVLIGLTYGPPRELFLDSPLYVAGLVVTVLLCGAAFVGHKDARMEGGHGVLSFQDIFRSAPLWAWVLVGIAMACMVAFVYQLPESAGGGSSSFSLDRAGLAGRPDRWRVCLSLFLVFGALGGAIAISAIRRRDAWMKAL